MGNTKNENLKIKIADQLAVILNKKIAITDSRSLKLLEIFRKMLHKNTGNENFLLLMDEEMEALSSQDTVDLRDLSESLNYLKIALEIQKFSPNFDF